MKRKLITGVVAAVSALTIGCLAGCSGCNNPAPADGAIYQTETESFWVGVGHAYISFEYQAEPANKAGDDNNIYGYVFKVMVSSGGDYESWLNGTWDLKEENNTYGDLTLTATWDTTADNQTKLAGTESGVAKVYTPDNGKYKIGVELPSAGTINFTLDPAKDKVGDKEPEAPAPEVCTNHVDNNCDGVCDNEGCNETVAINHVDVKNNETQAEGADGKCDKCGNDMLQVALTTEALGGGTINLYSDNTFDLSLTYGGKILEGEWAAASQTEITLTVDKATLIGGATVSPVGDILTVTVDPSGYPVMAYTCTTNYNTGEAEIPMTFTGSLTLS